MQEMSTMAQISKWIHSIHRITTSHHWDKTEVSLQSHYDTSISILWRLNYIPFDFLIEEDLVYNLTFTSHSDHSLPGDLVGKSSWKIWTVSDFPFFRVPRWHSGVVFDTRVPTDPGPGFRVPTGHCEVRATPARDASWKAKIVTSRAGRLAASRRSGPRASTDSFRIASSNYARSYPICIFLTCTIKDCLAGLHLKT